MSIPMPAEPVTTTIAPLIPPAPRPITGKEALRHQPFLDWPVSFLCMPFPRQLAPRLSKALSALILVADRDGRSTWKGSDVLGELCGMHRETFASCLAELTAMKYVEVTSGSAGRSSMKRLTSTREQWLALAKTDTLLLPLYARHLSPVRSRLFAQLVLRCWEGPYCHGYKVLARSLNIEPACVKRDLAYLEEQELVRLDHQEVSLLAPEGSAFRQVPHSAGSAFRQVGSAFRQVGGAHFDRLGERISTLTRLQDTEEQQQDRLTPDGGVPNRLEEKEHHEHGQSVQDASTHGQSVQDASDNHQPKIVDPKEAAKTDPPSSAQNLEQIKESSAPKEIAKTDPPSSAKDLNLIENMQENAPPDAGLVRLLRSLAEAVRRQRDFGTAITSAWSLVDRQDLEQWAKGAVSGDSPAAVLLSKLGDDERRKVRAAMKTTATTSALEAALAEEGQRGVSPATRMAEERAAVDALNERVNQWIAAPTAPDRELGQRLRILLYMSREPGEEDDDPDVIRRELKQRQIREALVAINLREQHLP